MGDKYCWWNKSCTTWDVKNPINSGIFSISTGAGFLPSAVCFTQITKEPIQHVELCPKQVPSISSCTNLGGFFQVLLRQAFGSNIPNETMKRCLVKGSLVSKKPWVFSSDSVESNFWLVWSTGSCNCWIYFATPDPSLCLRHDGHTLRMDGTQVGVLESWGRMRFSAFFTLS